MASVPVSDSTASAKGARPEESPPQLWSIRDLAAYLSVGDRTAWCWVSAGVLPPPTLRAGQVVRWDPAEIRAWLVYGGNR